MAKLSSEAKVGLLVLAGSVILLYMTFVVGKYDFGPKKGYRVVAIFDSVAGLDVQAAVRMAGVRIGTVEAVELEDSRAKVILRIDPGVRIVRGAEAGVKTMGLLGDKFVDIMPPRGAVPHERSGVYGENDRIESTSSPSDVDKLVGQLSAISDDIKQVTASLRQVFGTQRGEQSMEDILHDLRQTTANIKEFSFALKGDGGELIVRLNELAGNLNGIIGENRENLKVTMENIRETSRSAEMALASIENISKRIDNGEGTLGKLVNNDGMYNNIDSAVKGLGDYVSKVERLKTTIAFRSEYMFPKSKSYFTLELKPRPDQYYIAEILNDPYGKYTRTETVTNGVPSVTETYEDKLKFSVEFAKRWGNLALRLGLIESKGGLGGDVFLFNDRVKFSIDAWNMNSTEPKNDNTHMKATATWQVNKVLFVNGGYDNFLNTDRAAGFAGIGLRFDDDDLKYLIGSVPIPK